MKRSDYLYMNFFFTHPWVYESTFETTSFANITYIHIESSPNLVRWFLTHQDKIEHLSCLSITILKIDHMDLFIDFIKNNKKIAFIVHTLFGYNLEKKMIDIPHTTIDNGYFASPMITLTRAPKGREDYYDIFLKHGLLH